MTHYEVLGVNELAGGAKIKRHYYELCKKYHPDVTGGDPQKMATINEAYRVLSDATLKSAYDRELAAQRREAAFAHAAQTRQTAPTFHRAAQTAAPKKKSSWALFMAFGSAIALTVIVISYVMPVPKSASATDTPTVATTDTPTETSSVSTAPTYSTISDKNAQDALNTLQSDATMSSTTTQTPPPATTPSTSSSTTNDTTTQVTPRKHHRPISLWHNQNND